MFFLSLNLFQFLMKVTNIPALEFHEKKLILIEFPYQRPQKWKQIDYNQLKMDYNITIFRGDKIHFSFNIIDIFFTFVNTDNETKL